MERENIGDSFRPMLAGLLGWVFPGLGHLYARHYGAAGIFGLIVLLLLLLGSYLGGHLYGLFEAGAGFLSKVFGLFNMGLGSLYFIPRALGFVVTERPYEIYSEYGNILLMVGGLLNYLIALDAFDVMSGNKK